MKATAVIMFLSSLIRDDGDFEVSHKMEQACKLLAENNDCSDGSLLGLLQGEENEDEDEEIDWNTRLRAVEDGQYLKADHPQTVINPDTFFKVRHLRKEGVEIWARGRDTCWFNVEQCKLPEQEGVVISEAGFDTTRFKSAEDFIQLCEKYKLAYKSLAYIGKVTTNNDCFGFCGPKISVYTTNNPITGEYYAGENRRQNEKGLAGYIGVTGEVETLNAFCQDVANIAEFYKEFDPNCRSFI